MLSAQIEAVRSRMRSEIGGLRSEIEALRAEMRKRVRGTGAQAHQADHRTGSSHRAPGRATRPDSHALDRPDRPGGLSHLLRSGQVVLDGEFDQPYQIVNVELAHQAGAVGVHRLGADIQQIGNLLGAQTVHQVEKHIVLAPAEMRQGIVFVRLAGGRQQARDPQQRRHVHAAVANVADGVGQVAVGAGLQGSADGALLAADGEDDATRGDPGFADLAHHLHARKLRHVQVEQSEIRLERPNRLQRCQAVGALRDNLQVQALADQYQAFANDGLVLGYHDRRLFRVIHGSPEKKWLIWRFRECSVSGGRRQAGAPDRAWNATRYSPMAPAAQSPPAHENRIRRPPLRAQYGRLPRQATCARGGHRHAGWRSRCPPGQPGKWPGAPPATAPRKARADPAWLQTSRIFPTLPRDYAELPPTIALAKPANTTAARRRALVPKQYPPAPKHGSGFCGQAPADRATRLPAG